MNKTLLTPILKIIFTILFSLTTQLSNSQTVTVTTTGAGTFAVPCDVTSITVKTWGAGGAGGGSRTSGDSGDGGGAGGYCIGIFTVTSGQTINYIVGAGGTGGTDDGANGGNTTILSLGIAANGGSGGDRNGGSVTGLGGTASGGTINTSGANGTIGGSNTGGTGGSAPNGGAGGTGVTNGNGLNGNAPGGGGGGGEDASGGGGNRSGGNGGNGGNGRIEITYTSTFKTYCMPSFNIGVEPITNVTFAGINNNSTNVLGGPSLESFCITGSVIQGSVSNVISVKGNTDGNYTEFIKVYVDWDQNGVFGNTTNEIYDLGAITNSTGVDAKLVTANISVPGTAVTGNTKMRVMKAYTVANSNNPCFSGNDYGQVEDYNISVVALPTITSFTPTSSCVSSGASVVITGTNFTGATTVSFNGVSAVYSVNSSMQITATLPSTATTGTITVTTPAGTAVSATSFTVNALPTAPTFTPADIIQPTCAVTTGSVFLSGLPTSGTLRQNDGVTTTIIPYIGNSATVSGLLAATYTFTVSNGTCASLSSANVVINSVITNTWNGIAWSTGLSPTSTQKVVFTGNFNQDVDLVGCSCKITGGAAVTIRTKRTLTITNEVEVVGGGVLTFENNASLVQINDNALNAGTINYKRQTTVINKLDFTYWSSPVLNQKLLDVSPNTLGDKFYSFNGSTDNWEQENTANAMVRGKGYIIRGPQFFPAPNPPSGIHEATFVGFPNNGNVSIAIPFTGSETSNLIGNPYPSALDADLFLAANNLILDGTLYFWTHNSPPSDAVPGDATYNYTTNDYASYNLTGGVGTDGISYSQGGAVAPSGGLKPSGKIVAGQAFFATGIAAGNASFNNSMRVSGGTLGENNSQFFKVNKSSKTTNGIEKHRIWLNLTNDQGAFKQTLVGYVTNATNGYDNAFDGQSFDGNEFVDFYSVNEDKNLTIQGRALPFDENDEVLLGYSSTIAGIFSIDIDTVDGLLSNKNVFIEDKITNSIKNLKLGAYSFSTVAGTFNDRFVLHYKDKTLGRGDFETADTQIVISVKNRQIKVDSPKETIDKVLIFDLLGKQIYKKISIGNNEHIIPNLASSEQALVVKVVLQNGQTVSRKIIY